MVNFRVVCLFLIVLLTTLQDYHGFMFLNMMKVIFNTFLNYFMLAKRLNINENLCAD